VNRTCWSISELSPVCHDSTAALTVACSFCVQSAILSALIRSPYSRWTTTAAATAAARTRTGRRLCQQRQLQGRRNWQRQSRQQPRTTVAKCASWRHVLASHWCRADMRGTVKRVLCVCQLWMGEINQSINHYFIVRPNVNQRAGQLSLPHIGIIKQKEIELKTSMSSSYNTRCSLSNINL